MRIVRLAVIIIRAALLCASTSAVQGQPASRTNGVVVATPLVNALLLEAQSNNPALKAADLRVRAAVLNGETVRSWMDPNLALGGSVYSPRGFRPEEEGNLAYGLEQKLPLWNRSGLS